MFRQWVSSFRVLLLVAAGLMLASGTSRAGHGGGGHGGGGHGGGHAGGAHFSGARFGGGFATVHPGFHSFNHRVFVSPRFFGFGLGFGFPYGYGFGYPYRYGYGYPYGYGYGNTYAYASPTVNTYSSYYPPEPQAPPQDNAAHVMVVVPEGATLWFNGVKTAQKGTEREFISPVLTLGKNYTYEIKARWMENDKPVEQTRSVQVQANAWQVVDFTKPGMPQADN